MPSLCWALLELELLSVGGCLLACSSYPVEVANLASRAAPVAYHRYGDSYHPTCHYCKQLEMKAKPEESK